MFNITSRPLCLPGKEPRYPLNRTLSEPQSWSGCLREEVNLVFAGTRFLDFLSRYSSLYTDYLFYVSGDRIPVGRDFSPVQTGPGVHPASCTMGTRSFPGVKCRRGVLLTIHPLLVPRSWKSRAIPLPTLWATTGPVTGTLYLYFTYFL